MAVEVAVDVMVEEEVEEDAMVAVEEEGKKVMQFRTSDDDDT